MHQNDWNIEDLQNLWTDIRQIGVEKYGIKFYEPAFEVVTFEDMIRIYSTSLPVCYNHWSFGKSYLKNYDAYKANIMGIASEVIFNTNPSVCYLLNNNSYTLQALVIAHAAIGHSSFFANNYLFKEHTNANTIIPFLKKFRETVSTYEQQYGTDEVEELLDCCHALSFNAITHTQQKGKKKSPTELAIKRSLEKDSDASRISNEISTINTKKVSISKSAPLNDENILAFIGKHSPALKPWQREIIEKYCKVQQYLFPQMLTKIMNEGYATFWEAEIMEELYARNKLTDGQFIEFIDFHTRLIKQQDFARFNPYALGYALFKDIKRICTEPTIEDREWFPDLVDKDWVQEIQFAMANFKDSSFILQYLSPKVIRDMKLFSIYTTEEESTYTVKDIQDDIGYKTLRKDLSNQVDIMSMMPHLYVEGWDPRKSRSLFLVCKQTDRKLLDQDSLTVFKYIKKLWPYPVHLKTYIDNKFIQQKELGSYYE